MEKTVLKKLIGSLSKSGKILNISWKVALVFIGILSAFVLYRVAQDIYAEHYGKYAHTWDRRLSERICVHYIHRKGVKVYDLQAEKYGEGAYSDIATLMEKCVVAPMQEKIDEIAKSRVAMTSVLSSRHTM